MGNSQPGTYITLDMLRRFISCPVTISIRTKRPVLHEEEEEPVGGKVVLFVGGVQVAGEETTRLVYFGGEIPFNKEVGIPLRRCWMLS